MSGKTYLAILGGTAADYDILDSHLNKLIEDSQCYLFTILCGASKNNTSPPLSLMWADKNGCPVEFLNAEDGNIINKLFNKATYIIFILHKDDVFTKKLFMKYKMLGKHGSVIKV